MKPLIRELVNLVEECGFDRLDLLRIGAQIKRKQSRDESLHLAGADIISQTHLLADTNKETRSEITARFINQFQRVPVRAGQARAAETHHDHALRLVLTALDSFRFGQRRGRFCVCKCKRAGLHLSERLLDELLYLGCFNVAKDIEHTVLANYVTIAKIG